MAPTGTTQKDGCQGYWQELFSGRPVRKSARPAGGQRELEQVRRRTVGWFRRSSRQARRGAPSGEQLQLVLGLAARRGE